MCTYKRYWIDSISGPIEHLGLLLRVLRGIAVGRPTADRKELHHLLDDLRAGGYTSEINRRLIAADWLSGGYSVILSSWLETVLNQVLEDAGQAVAQGHQWKHIDGAFCAASGVGLHTISRHRDILRVRYLANCFKHGNGTADSNLAGVSEYKEGERIQYLLENWDELLKALREFLEDAISKLPQLRHPMPIEWRERGR